MELNISQRINLAKFRDSKKYQSIEESPFKKHIGEYDAHSELIDGNCVAITCTIKSITINVALFVDAMGYVTVILESQKHGETMDQLVDWLKSDYFKVNKAHYIAEGHLPPYTDELNAGYARFQEAYQEHRKQRLNQRIRQYDEDLGLAC